MTKQRELDFFENEYPICFYCANILTDSKGDKHNKCKAFPEGIPDNILYEDIAHNQVFGGQVGNYVFEEESS